MKKPDLQKKRMYANVVELNGAKCYSSFGTDLTRMIEDAETRNFGVIAIEIAHSKEPPVWERKDE